MFRVDSLHFLKKRVSRNQFDTDGINGHQLSVDATEYLYVLALVPCKIGFPFQLVTAIAITSQLKQESATAPYDLPTDALNWLLLSVRVSRRLRLLIPWLLRLRNLCFGGRKGLRRRLRLLEL